MKNIITIQHTQAIHHTTGMVGSWADWDLTQLGMEQAERIGKRLASELEGAQYVIYTSDLIRAKRTADTVGAHFNSEPKIYQSLRERNLGKASGKPKKWARENAIYHENSIDDKPFNGAESRRETWLRLKTFHDEIMAGNDENIIIVSHGDALSLFYGIWLGWEVEMLNNFELTGKAGGVSFLREDSSRKRFIGRLNDLSYIKE